MRMLVKVTMPHGPFNAAVCDGTANAKLEAILADLQPEAVYFTEFGGKRTGILIVDLPDATKIPALAEPWFLTFEADVQVHPVMLPEDLANAGIANLATKWA